mmetsp:Transcript_697/g.855  ORF Transcript_697/g.855 Transcript_697/m.855 type:complete len:172 (+) Transcript_697:1445-1960(+)
MTEGAYQGSGFYEVALGEFVDLYVRIPDATERAEAEEKMKQATLDFVEPQQPAKPALPASLSDQPEESVQKSEQKSEQREVSSKKFEIKSADRLPTSNLPQQLKQKQEGDQPTVRLGGPHIDPRRRIIRQIEYYFSNDNYYKDKFLLKEAKTHAADNFIPLEVLLTFNKVK